jgi:hypothetical protein
MSRHGLGQFKAPDASPPLFGAPTELREQYIELCCWKKWSGSQASEGSFE